MTTVEKSRPTRTESAEIVPFGGWDTTPHAEPLFRFPAADDPAPATSRLLGMSLYAAGLGLAGVLVGTRGLLILIGGAASWVMPVLALLALSSVAGSVAAFLSIHRPRLPWGLLLAATAPMAAAVVLAAVA